MATLHSAEDVELELSELLPSGSAGEALSEADARPSKVKRLLRVGVVCVLVLAGAALLCRGGARMMAARGGSASVISEVAIVTAAPPFQVATSSGIATPSPAVKAVVPVAVNSALVAAGATVHSNTLKPSEVVDDGNPCSDNEELYGGLCYLSCKVLTGVETSVRMSPNMCCKEGCDLSQDPTNLINVADWTESLLPCDGYDVSSTNGKAVNCKQVGLRIECEGTNCPHEPGACLTNEELSWGNCYEKCKILTEGKYPYRSAAGTCCKHNPAEDVLACMDPSATKTAPSLNVGGGAGDGDPLTSAESHPPDTGLTR